MCSICLASYAQRQGAWRHIRTVHKPKLCFLCEFKWGRRYEYRNHLKKHPGVDPDKILGEAPGRRRRRRKALILTERLPPQPPVLPPAVEQGQHKWAEFQPNPPGRTAPSPAGARVTSVSPPAVSSMDYNSQPVYVERTVMKEHEYVHTHAMLLSTEERTEPMNNWDTSPAFTSLQDGQSGYELFYHMTL